MWHDGLAQRGLVGSSRAARARAEATRNNATQRAYEAITKPRLHRQAQRFGAPEAAQAALTALATRWPDHRLESAHLTPYQRDAGKGRPTPRTPRKALAGQIQAQVQADDDTSAQDKHAKACDVLGTNIATREFSHAAVIVAYNGHAHVAGGCRFLKDPRFFVSSLCVKKPNRIDGWLMVLTLALLVYSVTQRRLRKP